MSAAKVIGGFFAVLCIIGITFLIVYLYFKKKMADNADDLKKKISKSEATIRDLLNSKNSDVLEKIKKERKRLTKLNTQLIDIKKDINNIDVDVELELHSSLGVEKATISVIIKNTNQERILYNNIVIGDSNNPSIFKFKMLKNETVKISTIDAGFHTINGARHDGNIYCNKIFMNDQNMKYAINGPVYDSLVQTQDAMRELTLLYGSFLWNGDYYYSYIPTNDAKLNIKVIKITPADSSTALSIADITITDINDHKIPRAAVAILNFYKPNGEKYFTYDPGLSTMDADKTTASSGVIHGNVNPYFFIMFKYPQQIKQIEITNSIESKYTNANKDAKVEVFSMDNSVQTYKLEDSIKKTFKKKDSNGDLVDTSADTYTILLDSYNNWVADS